MNENGRVVNVTNKIYKRDNLWTNLNNSKVAKNFQYESMIGIYEPTKLNSLFFSKKNLEIIQAKIRYGVYIKSNKKYIIGNQSDTEIQVVMRSIFTTSSKFDLWNY